MEVETCNECKFSSEVKGCYCYCKKKKNRVRIAEIEKCKYAVKKGVVLWNIK